MTTHKTLREAFARFDEAKATNSRWSWCAKSDQTGLVVLTAWRQYLHDHGGYLIYPVIILPDRKPWAGRPGNTDRRRRIEEALASGRSLFKLVVVDAPREAVANRRTDGRYVTLDDVDMRMIWFDPGTGEFLLRSENPVDRALWQ